MNAHDTQPTGSPRAPLTRWARASTMRGHLEVGGCDVVELVAEHGTPAYVYAEDDIRERARRFTAAFAERDTDDFEVLFASKSLPATAALRACCRGGAVGRRRLGRRAAHGARRRVRARADPHARQQQDRGRAPLRVRVRHRAPDPRLLRRDRARRRACSTAPSACCCGSRPGSRPRPTPTSRPGRRTRSSASAWPTGSPSARSRRSARRRTSSWSACTPTSARRSTSSSPSRRRSRCSPTSPAPWTSQPELLNVGGGLGIAYLSSDEPPSIEDYVAVKVEGVRTRLRPGSEDPDRARALAGRQRRGHRLPRRHGQGDPRGPHLRRRRRRDVRQPAPDALRRALRGRRSPTAPPRRPTRRSRSPACTASPATC